WSGKRDRPGFSRSILLVAQAAGLTELAAQLAPILQPETVAMRLPPARLSPSGGFRVDPALVYAMTRTESNFDPRAVSPAGARGLMQLMPLTADWVMRDFGPGPHKAGRTTTRLHDPATNLDLGQRYILYLASSEGIGSDLIRMLASYNSGPGAFHRWSSSIRHMGDPLLFIESVPIDETRAYIPRVLAYTWLYAARLKLPTPSLDELAAGTWPRFNPSAPRIKGRLH
ncbi:MAG: lytic transglycosylase domain-containing protein, partial [Gemmatimonadaceae bacterium]|nr:lytic transglycosylase domain-containing protein [Acetobacteraceae bacterium]